METLQYLCAGLDTADRRTNTDLKAKQFPLGEVESSGARVWKSDDDLLRTVEIFTIFLTSAV